MRRRALFLVAVPMWLRAGGRAAVRGQLIANAAKPALLSQGKKIVLEGDEATIAVLRDERIKDDDFEALGQFLAPDRFLIDPIHERALFLYRNGKRLAITYWCPICSIRTYTPGICVCCQEETELDPRDPALKDTDPSTA